MPNRTGIGVGFILGVLACILFANQQNYLLILICAAGAAWQLLEGIFGDN